MPVSRFLSQFRFIEDPFQSTNAGDEPLLEQYFVPPPYFASVLGDTSRPQSNVVLAPRGGGKTAQRVMIEKHSVASRDFMCITYDTFETPHGFKPEDATWSYHIHQINRLLLVGILVVLEGNDASATILTEQQKRFLKFGIDRYLGPLSSHEFEAAIASLKNLGDKARDLWHKYGGVVALAVNAAMQKWGLGELKLPPELVKSLDESLKYQFTSFLGIIRSLGFKATYILVDKVDELAITSKNAESVEKFIDGLITDLPTLEEPSVAFKFFLWDQIESDYAARGARPDRVPIFKLNWKLDELSQMLMERLKAYSEGAIDSVNRILCDDVDIDLHKLVCYFAAGSPRDMIRICKAIVAEQTRMRADDPCITTQSIWQGIRDFCNTRSAELFNDLGSLRRVGSVTFTINRLASEIFRQTAQSVRARIQGWEDSGAVRKIGEVPNPPNRPMYLFGIVDMRLAVAAQPGTDVDLILGNFVLQCPNCQQICITDRLEISCPHCSTSFESGRARSVLEICRRATA